MGNGIWKKYEKTTRKPDGERASYHELYDDLKSSRRSWEIAQDFGECVEQLCGVYLRTSGTEPEAGDIYVYYAEKRENLIPILYFKITEFEAHGNICHFIEYNGGSIEYAGISFQYLPDVIQKLREIDYKRNKEEIEELEKRYNNHQRILELQSQTTFTEEELLFLYDMYNSRFDIGLVESMIKTRNIQDDYELFSEEGKAKLFLAVKGTELENQLMISSRNVMTLIAGKRCLEQLQHTSLEILNDKEYMMSLLQVFLESDKPVLEYMQLKNFPKCYQIDVDILSLILYKYGMRACQIAEWLDNSPEGKEKINNPEFMYQLVEAFIRGLIRDGEPYYENELLWLMPNKILNDIEKHIMYGPEPNPSKGFRSGEDLKQISYERLLNHKAKILQYRKNR